MPDCDIDEQVKECHRLFGLHYEGKITFTKMHKCIKELWDRQLSIEDIEKEKVKA